jgi:hypothetical protein
MIASNKEARPQKMIGIKDSSAEQGCLKERALSISSKWQSINGFPSRTFLENFGGGRK